MNLFRPLIERFFPPHQPLPAGVYHYQAPPDAPFPYRLHLRIEPDGHGILIVNASTVVHLNSTAAEYAYHLVKNTPQDEAIASMARRYHVRKEVVLADYQDLIGRLKTLVDLPDLDPVAFLDFDRSEPYSEVRSAPYRLDCALTYRLPDEGGHALAPVDRVKRDLSESEWKTILEKAWNAGIPHAVFTGGEPTLRPDLVGLIAFGEELGMVTGLLTSGVRLSDNAYLDTLLNAGLDHIMILLDPQEDQSWEALRDALAADIAVTVHLTMTERTQPIFDEVLNRLVEMGVQNVSLSADGLGLADEIQSKRQALAERHLRLVWDLPVPYSQFHPVALELGQVDPAENKTHSGAGNAWLYVEPDGDVLPGQGHYQDVLGNLLTDPWEEIWQKAKEWKATTTTA